MLLQGEEVNRLFHTQNCVLKACKPVWCQLCFCLLASFFFFSVLSIYCCYCLSSAGLFFFFFLRRTGSLQPKNVCETDSWDRKFHVPIERITKVSAFQDTHCPLCGLLDLAAFSHPSKTLYKYF